MDNSTPSTIELVRVAAAKMRLYLPHAMRQMARPDRMIAAAEIRRVIDSGDMIEDYPDDPRGHGCLILGEGENGRPIHVVCAPKDEFLAVITAYLPDETQWTDGFRTRKEP